jgi:hypothetical protein
MSISILVARSSAEADLLTSCDDRLTLGDLPAFPVLGDGHRFVQRRGQQCRQAFRWPTARVAGPALLEAGVNRRHAVVRRVFARGL